MKSVVAISEVEKDSALVFHRERNPHGREYTQVIDNKVKLVGDPIVSEYVNRIGRNIV